MVGNGCGLQLEGKEMGGDDQVDRLAWTGSRTGTFPVVHWL